MQDSMIYFINPQEPIGIGCDIGRSEKKFPPWRWVMNSIGLRYVFFWQEIILLVDSMWTPQTCLLDDR